ncbi:maturase [Bacillus proteolyticus]|uniref:Maturase n=1 Tax=Bacillus proteolyticus TaxID=2026192 RepID=A0AA44R8X2_9BACI|nr:reverse transcriptase/maturase family protein [Bacillus proteolyticus]OJE49914.1 maturase [Bacillus proteolyticus]
MRTTEAVLNIISERGKKGLPIERIYRLLYNRELYLMAYQNIYSNNGSMTKGITEETVDGMSMKKIDDIIEKVKRESYRWTPVRRTYIPKKNGKMRPLGMPSWSDKLLQEVMRIIMNAYYDPQFSDKSHGFRENRGCQTALEAIRYRDGWKSVKWFVEGDISDCFGSINHEIIIRIMSEKIHDSRFLRLIKHLLVSGYMEDWKYSQTLSGCPQGGILSPLLSNIYMNKLDQYVEKTLIHLYTSGIRRTENKEYRAILKQIDKYKRHGNWQKVKELRKIAQQMPSKNPTDPKFKRLYYVRYADDWLIGLSGSKQDAEEVKAKIKTFLKTELNLNLSPEKTLITHAREEKARFLGYDIHVLHCNTQHDRRGQRIINGVIGLRVPEDKMKAKMNEYMAKGQPIHRKERTTNSDYDIVSQFQAEFRGFAQYYLLAYNAHQLHNVKRVMERSLARTLANKHKTTINKVFKKYKKVLKTKDGEYKVLHVAIERENKKPLATYFGGMKLAYNKTATIIENPVKIFNTRTQLIDRLRNNTCELCGARGNIEMHHVKKLKNLRNNSRKEKPEWIKRMVAMNRKTLAVCEECHDKIHAGKYNGMKIR